MIKPAFTSLAKPSSCQPQGLCTCCLGRGEGQKGGGQGVEPRTLRDGHRFEWPSSPWMLQFVFYTNLWTFPGGSDDKESACNVVDLGSTSGSGRSPGEENGYPLQLSCLENPMDRGAWQATVHRSVWSRIWLSDRHYGYLKMSFQNLSSEINCDRAEAGDVWIEMQRAHCCLMINCHEVYCSSFLPRLSHQD